jgi:acetyl esterase/lipase
MRPTLPEKGGRSVIVGSRARTNIERYGGDLTHVAIVDESAGGNPVLNAAYMANRDTLRVRKVD